MKRGFTSEEGATHRNTLSMVGNGFTLAEVLIALAIIGVVAAMTIPTLISKINSVVIANQKSVIEKRLLSGLNRFNTLEEGFTAQYSTSKEFLESLSKYYKMAKICSVSELRNCIPYDKITDNDVVRNINNITLAQLGLKDNYLEPAGFVSAGGTPFILALKKDCIWDSGKAMLDITDSQCLTLLYDYNGSKSPNKVTKDIVELGDINIKGYYAKVGGVTIMHPARYADYIAPNWDCNAELALNYDKNICNVNTYIGNASKWCYDHGWAMATRAQLQKITNGLVTRDENDKPVLDVETAVNVLNLKGHNNSNVTESVFDFRLLNPGIPGSANARFNIKDTYANFYGVNDNFKTDNKRQFLCVAK